MSLEWKNLASYRDTVLIQHDDHEQIKIADACRNIAAMQPHSTEMSVLKKIMNSFWRGRFPLFLLLCPRVEIQNRKRPTRRAYLFEERDGCIWRTRDTNSPDSRWEIAPKHEKDDGPFEYVDFDDTPGWQQVADREKVIHDPAFVLHAIQQATQAVPRDMEPNEHTWRYINNLSPLPSFIIDWFSESYCERVDLVRWCGEEDFEIPKSWRQPDTASVSKDVLQCANKKRSKRQVSAADLRRWYARRVAGWPSSTRPPTRDQDVSDALAHFSPLGLTVTEARVYAVRNEEAPDSWTTPGRRRKSE